MPYRRSIFVFLDILGFRGLVEKSTADEVGRLLEILRQAAKPDDDMAQELEMSFLTFSDCTVRAVPLESKSNKKAAYGILWHELNSLVHTQSNLIQEGYFLRGSVTIGDISVDGSTVFGPAIVRGYSLESEFAVYPRIVIDPMVFEAFENEPLLRHKNHDVNRDREHIRQLVRRDSDGLYFIDYLRAILTEFDEEGQEIEFLADHKKLIVKHGTAEKKLTKIAAKYLWLAAYHNALIRKLGQKAFTTRGLRMKDFLIAKDELPVLSKI